MTTELTDTQLAELEADLIALESDLTDLLAATESGEQPVKLEDNAGRLTRMDEMHSQSILKANRNLTQNRLREVMAAITRFELGTYGDCTSCDEPIPYEQLKAYPEANMCIGCKDADE